MMLVIPAIDLRSGQCVRLKQGQKNQQTVYSQDPVSVAKQWESLGAQRIHLVDLDGAFEGSSKNWEVIQAIRGAVKVELELGGGLREENAVARVLKAGIDYAILGSMLVTDPVLAQHIIKRFPSKIMAAVDCAHGKVSIKGWQEKTRMVPEEFGKTIMSWGISQAIYTDVARDGMLCGPNGPVTASFAKTTGLKVIVSGGVTTVEDVKAMSQLQSHGIIGVIIGKALYDGLIDYPSALKAANAVASKQ